MGRASLSAPPTRTVTNLRAPSPSRRRAAPARSAGRPGRLEARQGRIRRIRDLGVAGLAVAKSISVSEVEVSPSTVTQLKLSFAPRARSACAAFCERAASVKTKASIVAMSGAIMPAPLAMPLIRTRLRRSRPRGGELREGVGGHDRARGLGPAAARPAPAGAIIEHALEPFGGQRLADHAGRGDVDLALGAAAALRRSWPSGRRRRAEPPVKALALPEFTTSARADPFDSDSRTNRRGEGIRAGEDARRLCPRIETHEQHVGAAAVADAACAVASRTPGPVADPDRRQARGRNGRGLGRHRIDAP